MWRSTAAYTTASPAVNCPFTPSPPEVRNRLIRSIPRRDVVDKPTTHPNFTQRQVKPGGQLGEFNEWNGEPLHPRHLQRSFWANQRP